MMEQVRPIPDESGTGIALSADRRSSGNRGWLLLSAVLLVTYLVIIASTFLDYGITYDEDWHLTYGRYILNWYMSGFQDTSALTYWVLVYAGGFYDTLASLMGKVLPFGVFESSHLINALFGFVAVFYAVRLANLLGGPVAGFLAGAFLVLTPRFYGHSFHNAQDIPFAALSAASLYYIVRTLRDLPFPAWSLLVALGVALGLALAIRIPGIVLIGYLAGAWILWLITTYSTSLQRLFYDDDAAAATTPSLWRCVARLAGLGVIICAIAYLVMLIWWPAAQVDPLVFPAKAFRYLTHWGYPFKLLFDGHILSSADLPWHYLVTWFLITLPEFYFAAFTVGLVLGGIWLVGWLRRRRQVDRPRFLGTVVVLTAAFLPVIYASITQPVNYDEARHFLFVVPPLAIAASLPIAALVNWLSTARGAQPSHRAWRLGAAAVVLTIVAVLGLVTIVDMVQLHPYQYTYFNRLVVGGLARASQRYETDYWGASLKEAAEWIVENYPSGHSGEKTRVASCLYSKSTSHFLPADRFEYIGSYHDGQAIREGEIPDLFVASPRWNCDLQLSGDVIHAVTRQGATLSYVIQVADESQEPHATP